MLESATVQYARPNQTAFIRWMNRLDRFCGLFGRTPPSLEPASLLQEASRRSNLTDFGSESFREPFEVLLAGLRDEVALTPFGRRLAHDNVLDWLRLRLRIQQELRSHPEILDLPVPRPLMIVGPPRTGTTLLHRLLSLDPAGRSLRTWEAMWPVPPDSGSDRRRQACGRLVWMANHWIMPDWNRMHPFTREGPEECAFLLAHTFVCPPMMPVPAYREWLRRQPDAVFDQAYTEYRRALQLLQAQMPATGHWVLKSPVHFWALDSLMKALPQARVVHTHRRMEHVLPSYCSLQSVLLSVYSERVDPVRMGPVMMDIACEAVTRFDRARETSEPGCIVDLPYGELVADPTAAVRRIYNELGYVFTPVFEQRLRAFLAQDGRSPRPRHRYTLEQFGLSDGAVSEAFRTYHDRYGLTLQPRDLP